jgi:phosphoribosylformylglycinamidine synthase
VACLEPLEPSQKDVLSQLLTYGEPFQAATVDPTCIFHSCVPRLGTVSPWASKATDIAHNCGLQLRRIERLVVYSLQFSQAKAAKAVTAATRMKLSDILHDRMTESIIDHRDDALALFTELQAPALLHVDVLLGGREALVKANQAFGLALAEDEIDYLLHSFSTIGQKSKRR